jgi:hypothetical protein
MNQRPSLLDQAGISDKPRGGGGGGRGSTNWFQSADKRKLAVAGVLLLLAAAGIAWGLGLFAGGPPKVDPEERAQREERYEEQVEREKKRIERMPEPPIEAGG